MSDGSTGEPIVLVVDDNAALVDVYSAWLQDVATVEATTDPAVALDAAADVDVVLLDRQMPSTSGDELLQRMRDRGIDVPTAMVTGVEPDVDVVELGFDDYVVKPVDEAALRETVAALHSRASYDAEFRRYFALVSKKAALEANLSERTLAASEEYHDLQRRLEAAADDAEASLDDLLATDDSPFRQAAFASR